MRGDLSQHHAVAVVAVRPKLVAQVDVPIYRTGASRGHRGRVPLCSYLPEKIGKLGTLS